MSKIVRYVPLVSPNAKELQDRVLEGIAKGYQPFGSLTVSHGGYGNSEEGFSSSGLFCQAIVMYSEEVK